MSISYQQQEHVRFLWNLMVSENSLSYLQKDENGEGEESAESLLQGVLIAELKQGTEKVSFNHQLDTIQEHVET